MAFSLWQLLFLLSVGSWAPGIVAHGLSCPMACGIFQTRGWTHVPWIGRQILNHCTTREVWRKQFLIGRNHLRREKTTDDKCRQVCVDLPGNEESSYVQIPEVNLSNWFVRNEGNLNWTRLHVRHVLVTFHSAASYLFCIICEIDFLPLMLLCEKQQD